MKLKVIISFLLMIREGYSRTFPTDSETINSHAQCEMASKQIEREDHATIVDDSSTRLHSTWLSEQCEARAGPEYIIRKYTFFKNDTFLLLRHHYVEESCSIATHTISIRGSIKLLSASTIVPGATETKFYVNTVHIIPLNRQVAHKFGHKLNVTCGPQPKWRPWTPQLVYEQSQEQFTNSSWYGPIYNSLQGLSSTKKQLDTSCLESFGIKFDELNVLRVQQRSLESKIFADNSQHGSRFELLLGSPAPNVHSRWNHKPTSLQSTVLIRADTTNDCLICSSVSRGTEFSPPLLHEVAALPALIGGSWLSDRCESYEGGVWSKKQLHIHWGDKLWTGRWDYYSDSRCSVFLYAVTAAGNYVLRPTRSKRHEIDTENNEELNTETSEKLDTETNEELDIEIDQELDTEINSDYFVVFKDTTEIILKKTSPHMSIAKITPGKPVSCKVNQSNKSSMKEIKTDDDNLKKTKRSLGDHNYQHLRDEFPSMIQPRFAAMLRGQVHEINTKRPTTRDTHFGTTELDLHVAESILIPGHTKVFKRCAVDQTGKLLTTWSRNCVPYIIEAPSILALKVKLGINWVGQYILHLGSQDDDVWEGSLRQCAQIPFHNPDLRAHLRRSIGLRFGLFSSASEFRISNLLLLSQLFLCYLYYIISCRYPSAHVFSL